MHLTLLRRLANLFHGAATRQRFVFKHHRHKHYGNLQEHCTWYIVA